MILQNWWYTTLLGLPEPMAPPLSDDIEADVVVVGAGMAGIAAALRLMSADRRVVVLERNIFGGSSTGKSAGFLTPDSELELAQLVRRFGPEGAKDLWRAPVRGIELMVSTAQRYAFDCELVKQDSLFLGNGSSGCEAVREEVEARETLGFPSTPYDREALPGVLGSARYAGGVRYTDTWGVNPLRFAQRAKRVLLDHGVRIYEGTEVVAIDGHSVRTHLGSVRAGEIIFCADKLSPAVTRFARNVYHAQTFLSVSEPLGDHDVDALFPNEPLQCWDSDLVYTYFRLTGDGRLLVGGGSALTTFALHAVTSPAVIGRVLRRFKSKFPCIEHVKFVQYWPGFIDTTRDLLPTVLKDEAAPWVHYVLGCVGLPWAAFCGDFVARHVIDTGSCDDHQYYRYFTVNRPFFLPLWAQRIVSKPLLFSLNNAFAKYYQVDRGKDVPRRRDNF